MDFSPQTLRKQFHKLTAEHDDIQAELEPLRAELDSVVAGKGDITVKQARAREDKLRPQIKKLQEKLYPIEMQRAALARALGGKTGQPE